MVDTEKLDILMGKIRSLLEKVKTPQDLHAFSGTDWEIAKAFSDYGLLVFQTIMEELFDPEEEDEELRREGVEAMVSSNLEWRKGRVN